MKLPARITLTDWGYALDGGSITLEAVTETGERCSIRLNQRVFDSYENPGRLLFDNELVEVRSSEEQRIVELLAAAEITPDEGGEGDSDATPISE
ncbi:MAG: hypothetical protein AAF497_26045, partial [Planctomycetota bacterium]